MSTFTDAVTTASTLAGTAKEEAQRLGSASPDIDHLLVALTLDTGRAGQVLRAAGLHVARVREAAAHVHADQIASLGLSVSFPEPRPVQLPAGGTPPWTERARSLAGPRVGEDSADVLGRLLAEPSGLIRAILRHLHVDPAVLRTALDVAPERSTPVRLAPTFRTTDLYVPAPPSQVWAAVADPARLHEWDGGLTQLSPARQGPDGVARWDTETRAESPDGTPLPAPHGMLAVEVERVEATQDRRVHWRSSYPDAPRQNSRNVVVDIAPEGEGSRLTLTFGFLAPPDRPALRRGPLNLLFRFSTKMELTQIHGGLSRMFRAG